MSLLYVAQARRKGKLCDAQSTDSSLMDHADTVGDDRRLVLDGDLPFFMLDQSPYMWACHSSPASVKPLCSATCEKIRRSLKSMCTFQHPSKLLNSPTASVRNEYHTDSG